MGRLEIMINLPKSIYVNGDIRVASLHAASNNI